MSLRERIIYQAFGDWMFKRKTLILTGARQVGKTTSLWEILKDQLDVLFLNADEQRVRSMFEDASIPNLKSIIGSNKIVVIDEVQRIENPGLILKLLHDSFPDKQFIATGSSALEISDRIFEPLTGRHILFHMYPFSMHELYPQTSSFHVAEDLPFHLVFGTYPEVAMTRDGAQVILKNLANQYLYKDVLAWKDIRKPDLLNKLLQLLAYQIGSEVSVHELATSLKVKSETVENYLDLLEKSFVIFRLQAYSNNPRKEVSKMSKIYFWDNGIRNAVIENFDLLPLRQDVGQLWENFLISDRMKMNAFLGREDKSYFWRNYNQAEVDYVEVTKNQINAYEIKWKADPKAKISRAFLNLYPNAVTKILNPNNFMEFCGKEND